jgi:hypothetical protein
VHGSPRRLSGTEFRWLVPGVQDMLQTRSNLIEIVIVVMRQIVQIYRAEYPSVVKVFNGKVLSSNELG